MLIVLISAASNLNQCSVHNRKQQKPEFMNQSKIPNTYIYHTSVYINTLIFCIRSYNSISISGALGLGLRIRVVLGRAHLNLSFSIRPQLRAGLLHLTHRLTTSQFRVPLRKASGFILCLINVGAGSLHVALGVFDFARNFSADAGLGAVVDPVHIGAGHAVLFVADLLALARGLLRESLLQEQSKGREERKYFHRCDELSCNWLLQLIKIQYESPGYGMRRQNILTRLFVIRAHLLHIKFPLIQSHVYIYYRCGSGCEHQVSLRLIPKNYTHFYNTDILSQCLHLKTPVCSFPCSNPMIHMACFFCLYLLHFHLALITARVPFSSQPTEAMSRQTKVQRNRYYSAPPASALPIYPVAIHLEQNTVKGLPNQAIPSTDTIDTFPYSTDALFSFFDFRRLFSHDDAFIFLSRLTSDNEFGIEVNKRSQEQSRAKQSSSSALSSSDLREIRLVFFVFMALPLLPFVAFCCFTMIKEQCHLRRHHRKPSNLPSLKDSHIQLRCSVCLNDSVQVVTTCGHWYHVDCLSQWFRRQRTCPYCRAREFRVCVLCRCCGNQSVIREKPCPVVWAVDPKNSCQLQQAWSKIVCQKCSGKQSAKEKQEKCQIQKN